MKTILTGIIFLLLIHSHTCLSQRKAMEAYWVVETNKKTAAYSVVRLYDVNHQLLFEKKMEGIVIDINRRRNRRMLNRMVDHYYANMAVIPDKLLRFDKGFIRLVSSPFIKQHH